MGLFDIFKRKDESAIPEPGTPEFQAAVDGSVLPDAKGVQMGAVGWTAPGHDAPTQITGLGAAGAQIPPQALEALHKLGLDPNNPNVHVETQSKTIDLRGTGARDQMMNLLKQNGIDPDKKGQQIDASNIPGLQDAIMGLLKQNGVDLTQAGMQIPAAGGVAGWVGNAAAADPLAVVEQMAAKRDSGEMTQAEFEAQKKRLLGN